MSGFVSQCLARYKTPPGERLIVHQWSYTAGNQPDPEHPTLRAALDAVSTKVQIQLLGNDAHHAAFNSLGLAQAKNSRGQVVGLSKATLAGEFAQYKPFVGVDSTNRGQLLELLVGFELDMVLTSDHEWCDYQELDGIAIHQLLTGDDGDDAVTTARFTCARPTRPSMCRR